MRDGSGWLTKPLMFLSSYAPLFLILAIRFEGRGLKITCSALALVGVTGLFTLMHFQRIGSPGEHHLISAQPAGDEATSYLAGYLLPFVTIGTPGARDLVGYLVFLLVAFVVNVRTAVIQVNPTLFLFGWTVYRITDDGGFTGYLIGRERVAAGSMVHAYRMTGDVLLLRQVAP